VGGVGKVYAPPKGCGPVAAAACRAT
jgi:hypothetical protein